MSTVSHAFYELHIGGRKLDGETLSYIESVVYEDNAQGSDLLAITISDPNFIFLEDKLFIEETPIIFKGGWSNDVSIHFQGFIAVIDIDFPEEGSPSLVLNCMDKSHIMNRKDKKKSWKKRKRSDVAREIFLSYGLTPHIDATPKVVDTITQSNKTDIKFLIELADAETEDYLVYVEGNNGYFKKKKRLAEPSHNFKYRQEPYNLYSFSPTINKQEKKEEVSKSDINPKTKGVETAVANDSTQREVQGKAVSTTSNIYHGGDNWKVKEEIK